MRKAVVQRFITGFSWSRYWETRYPSGLTATVDSDTQITLSWTNNGTVDYDGVSIERSTDGVTYAEIITIAAGLATYINTGLTEDTLYYYRIRYYKGSNYSAYSNIASDSTLIGLTRGVDIVEVAGYDAIAVASNIGSNAAGRSFLNQNNKSKIRTNGTISRISYYAVYDATDWGTVSQFWFQVWRNTAGTYSVVYEEDIYAKITIPPSDTITVNLASAVSVLEGDYVGFACISTADPVIFGAVAAAATSLRYANGGKRADGFAWDAQSSVAFNVPVKVYGQAPMEIAIGDSIVAGHPTHYSYVEASKTDSKLNSFPAQMYILNAKNVCQNMGIGGQATTSILGRFTADCINIKPKLAIINGGVNDIAGGGTKVNFMDNWTDMLDACDTAGIIPVALKILPWNNGSNAQMQTRDDWMTDLEALVATYSGSVWVDFDTDMGMFRVGGDAGNLWDLKVIYNQDGVHPTLAGYTKMAELINNAISAKYYLH